MRNLRVMLFWNGNTVCFEDGVQVPALQASWLRLYVDFLKNQGVDVEGLTMELPNGREATWSQDNWAVKVK